MTASLTIAPTATDPCLLADLAGRLHGELQRRLAATTNPALRAQRTLAWWLRGTCIEAVTGLALARQRFVMEAHGRPRLATEPGLNIGLTHTSGLAGCLVSLRGAVGVDVESLTRRANWPRLERRLYTARERVALSALPAAERGAERIRLWTLKEAWAKCDGRGVSMGLGTIACRRAGSEWSVSAAVGPAMARVGQCDIDSGWSLAWVLAQPEGLRMMRVDPASGAARALSGVV